ncbi:hypothetical protein SLITO_v1c09600 [Spiroplasma litorale]|uniref:Uncharacterized protein n=1 Tax=Spiroplasma litorale TaxID=216942 RepID=A0A0K1W315_9MOLU|nr:hypothetical protein [Spiroplasma litorale]AKX34571.1 hypothetical protein SLITO_v1c09600 [Spiroplasma litorale]
MKKDEGTKNKSKIKKENIKYFKSLKYSFKKENFKNLKFNNKTNQKYFFISSKNEYINLSEKNFELIFKYMSYKFLKIVLTNEQVEFAKNKFIILKKIIENLNLDENSRLWLFPTNFKLGLTYDLFISNILSNKKILIQSLTLYDLSDKSTYNNLIKMNYGKQFVNLFLNDFKLHQHYRVFKNKKKYRSFITNNYFFYNSDASNSNFLFNENINDYIKLITSNERVKLFFKGMDNSLITSINNIIDIFKSDSFFVKQSKLLKSI